MTSAEIYAVLAGIFIGFITIAILVGIIVKQRQTIRDYETPKYGFLGKKLSAYLLGVTALGIAGVFLFPTNLQTLDDSVSVSDDIYLVSIDISAEPVELGSSTYFLKFLVYFDGQLWAQDGVYYYVEWDINGDKYYESIGSMNQGGFTVDLLEGSNTIRGTINLIDTQLVKEITVFVE